MKCPDHRRDTIGACMWCGKQLCPQCVARQEGKKLYCEKCVSILPQR